MGWPSRKRRWTSPFRFSMTTSRFTSIRSYCGNLLRCRTKHFIPLWSVRSITWIHGGNTDREHLESWLRQFERLNVPWIGESLLKSLDFWSADRQKRSFGISDNLLKNYDRICVNSSRVGKSGDFLANILRKQVDGLKSGYPNIIDFRELLETREQHDKCEKILLVEDGLFTGTEVTNFFSALLNKKHPKGRPWKTPPLRNPNCYLKKKLFWNLQWPLHLGWKLPKYFCNRTIWRILKLLLIIVMLTLRILLLPERKRCKITLFLFLACIRCRQTLTNILSDRFFPTRTFGKMKKTPRERSNFASLLAYNCFANTFNGWNGKQHGIKRE